MYIKTKFENKLKHGWIYQWRKRIKNGWSFTLPAKIRDVATITLVLRRQFSIRFEQTLIKENVTGKEWRGNC